ncbi:hypothetical protein PFICI_06014 [Pestalotiopsis fici W106-1]|uniref:Uncharacterized protein n=1 Tax=Pestalotiopsis fici (strain W106-1 / CGMCC3.15140) TaxID=1229662 RepID=W3X6I2_PESFW|nr:uncharacterized protein PFICI_06014 [Pestalotiopsis fici W106-1]ETS81012.1 hypothetical protein PFICI_06014 [Pestalotiopsis fici W106-1]
MSLLPSYNLTAPRRITASNLDIPSQHAGDDTVEPGVEVRVDSLAPQPLFDGFFVRAVVGTEKQVPTSNDGHGEIPLDEVPGIGIVLPGGVHMYYLDIAPNYEGALHRTTSTDYLVVISGKLSLMTPESKSYQIKDGKATCGSPVETVANPGDIIYQRGPVHALSNHTNEWVRVLAVVLGSEPNKALVEGTGHHRELHDQWLA